MHVIILQDRKEEDKYMKINGKKWITLALMLIMVFTMFYQIPDKVQAKVNWRQIYYDFLQNNSEMNKLKSEKGSWGTDDWRFDLVYLDKNSVPELVIHVPSAQGNMALVSIYKGKARFCDFKYSGYNDRVFESQGFYAQYIKKKGKLAITTAMMGASSGFIFRFNKGKLKLIAEGSLDPEMAGSGVTWTDSKGRSYSGKGYDDFKKYLHIFFKEKKALEINSYGNTMNLSQLNKKLRY